MHVCLFWQQIGVTISRRYAAVAGLRPAPRWGSAPDPARGYRPWTPIAAESCGMHECWHVCSRGRGRKGLAERVAQPTGAAGGAWGEEQQEDELRTTGGRWPMLAFWLLVLGELS